MQVLADITVYWNDGIVATLLGTILAGLFGFLAYIYRQAHATNQLQHETAKQNALASQAIEGIDHRVTRLEGWRDTFTGGNP